MHDALLLRRPERRQIVDAIAGFLPAEPIRRIALKPNWVMHQQTPYFPITALVTDPLLVDCAIEACLATYTGLESIVVGDVPLQSCDFDLLLRQSGTTAIIEKYRASRYPRIEFRDLRRERWRLHKGFLIQDTRASGDPLGYAEISLDDRSLLDEVSHNAEKFRVSDYDPTVTTSVHRKGSHRYLVARSILDSDLVLNLPKMKTHQKVGVTGALKNLVGINGSKAHLVHHQRGKPSQGGDEFPEDVDIFVLLQSRLRERLQKSRRLTYRALRPVWNGIKKVRGIETIGTPENLSGRFYVGAGSWYGNDSIWRMVYDLNMIILLGDAGGGRLGTVPQRFSLSILDGLTGGEGNGPLQPIPVDSGIVVMSGNPFLVDFIMAQSMGFDWRKIPLLRNFRRFPYAPLVEFSPETFRVAIDGHETASGVAGIPVIKDFLPPPGWRGHITREGEGSARGSA